MDIDSSDLSDMVDVLDEEESASDDAERGNDVVLNLAEAKGAEISRKRSLKRTSLAKALPAKKAKIAHGSSTKLVKLKPQSREEEFPGEFLQVPNGLLYCNACNMVLSMKKSIVVDHISSDRHASCKEEKKRRELRQQKVLVAWESYQQRHAGELAGTGLSVAADCHQSLARIDTVRAFLKAGIPLAKISYLRPLLEDGSARLTDPSHLNSYIPFILETEAAQVKEELKGAQHLSVIFDGSTYQGEALAILVRFVNGEFEIVQRLVRVYILEKSVNGQELAREIATALSTHLPIPASCIVAAVRDGASVNESAVHMLQDIMYPKMRNIVCISHALDNVGKRIETPLLDRFLHWWVALFFPQRGYEIGMEGADRAVSQVL